MPDMNWAENIVTILLIKSKNSKVFVWLIFSMI